VPDVPAGSLDQLGIVMIGRNEGERLKACLASAASALKGETARIVYVDSGSTDGSPELAERFGVRPIQLDPALPFTAARGRNEGFSDLRSRYPDVEFVQFVDGDCELANGWCEAAVTFLAGHGDVAVVCGRLRELHPDRSVYNQLCDLEWDAPDGEAAACGGIALVRAEAFAAVGGFRSHLIAGEEPELCIRLRESGWIIWRLGADMAVHDADMSRFGQWWRRSVRSGAGFVQVALLHRGSRYAIWGRETGRAVAWGGLLPLAIIAGSAIHPGALLMILAYPAQMGRIALRQGLRKPLSWQYAFFMTIGKIAEFQGVLAFFARRLRERWAGPAQDRDASADHQLRAPSSARRNSAP
jgi:GT2 family glycosyltransferase